MSQPGRRTPWSRCPALVAAVLASIALVAPAGAQHTVAARDLPRNHVLVAADLAPAPDSLALPPDRQAAAAPEPGWVTRRVVRAGEPLRAPAVVPPPAIAAGDTVTIVWTLPDGIRVTRAGVALGSASTGQLVLVRIGALRRLRTFAVGPSTVEVR